MMILTSSLAVVMTKLYIKLVMDALNEYGYDAEALFLLFSSLFSPSFPSLPVSYCFYHLYLKVI